MWLRPFYYPKSFYALGTINAQQGDTLRAIEHYEKFLELPRWITLSTGKKLFDNAIPRALWKNADEDLPDLIDAKARYARLKGE